MCYNESMSAEFSGQREGEEVEFVFRRHWLEARKGILFLVFMIGVSIVPLVVWQGEARGFWVWGGCMVLGIIGFLYSHMLWHFSVYIVTNQRIRQVSQKGLFKRTVVDLGLDKIQSVSYNVPGLIGGVMGYGTLLIQTQVGDMEIEMVSQPEKTYNKIQNLLGILEYEEE